MATSKSGKTFAELSAQIAALQAQADALRQSEMAEVIAKVKDAITHYSLTAADLGFGSAARKRAKSPAAVGDKPNGKRRQTSGGKSTPKKVKFRDDQGNTWGGMGKRPDWFRAALASGKKPEDLLAKA